MFFIAYTFIGQMHVFAGQVKIVSLPERYNLSCLLDEDSDQHAGPQAKLLLWLCPDSPLIYDLLISSQSTG